MRTALLLLIASATALRAQAPTATPQLAAAPSTRASSIVNLEGPRGSTLQPQQIRIDYGQPHLRGRALHTGNLVPLDSVWRLGANATTSFETGVDLVIGGQRVPKGKYTLYALPSAAGSWKLIVSKDTSQTPEYKPAQDLVRIDLTKRSLPQPIETLSITLVPSTQPGTPSGDLRILWGTTELMTRWSMAQ